LLLEWQRANNPNFVEPVKRASDTKAEKKEKRVREKLEKKRLASEAAVALGLNPTAIGKKSGITSPFKKMGKRAAAAAVVRLADVLRDELSEDLDDLDSEVEVEGLIQVTSIKLAKAAS
jgi:SAGA-associated factor 73